MAERKLYYIAQAYQIVPTAGAKPMSDFEVALEKSGFKNLGLKSRTIRKPRLWWIYNRLSAFIGSIRMPSDSIVFLQYPQQRHIDRLARSAIRRNCKIIVLIHDLDELRGLTAHNKEVLKNASVIIAHTDRMSGYVAENYPQAQTVTLGLFDCLDNIKNTSGSCDYESIVFAGNLEKSLFLEKLPHDLGVKIHLYGPHPTPKMLENPSIEYHGAVSPEQLSREIPKYGFGLVWDGDSLDGCTGTTGQYLKYNIPYKAVTYLAAGLPVIIWDNMAIRDIVERSGAGISIASLQQISSVIGTIDEHKYAEMQKRLNLLSQKLRAGQFALEALKKALSKI